MGKIFIIHDDQVNSYEILDIKSFYGHLKEFHLMEYQFMKKEDIILLSIMTLEKR
tara:strand:- start:477 stop:641 length:165 start_codon:yes stop_codon:yes gene_type:complete